MDPHHCFFRSEYKKDDWDGDWNKVWISRETHDNIHFKGNRKLERFYKLMAYKRYKGSNKAELESIMRHKFGQEAI